jgi:hypothetical protein
VLISVTPFFAGACKQEKEPAEEVVPLIFQGPGLAALSPRSLHLVEHVRESRLGLQRLLDFIGTHVGILTGFQEAWALMLANELDERWPY